MIEIRKSINWVKGDYEVVHRFSCKDYKKALKVYAEIDKKDKEEKFCLNYENKRSKTKTGGSMNFIDALYFFNYCKANY